MLESNKLSFAINNLELIEDNPDSNFSMLSMDFFASGMNRHETYVSEDTLIRTANTIKNVPVVWKYDPILDDSWSRSMRESIAARRAVRSGRRQ